MTDFFNIFIPEWWMNENNSTLDISDAVLFLLFCIPVAYLFVCALFSMGKYKNPYPKATVQHRFLVLFTVLKEGQEVIKSINEFIDTQIYPREKYDIAVAATGLNEDDLITLLQMPINIVIPDKDQCTKVYAIQQVMERYSPHEYDMIVILNGDNHIDPNALELFNDAYYSGCDSIQAHRITRNLESSIAVIGAVSEEINNNLFRKGHTKMGFSSALIGSAMAFDFAMFHEIAPTMRGGDTSTAMEIALLKQNIYTEYLEEVVCYSRKEDNNEDYKKKRVQWAKGRYYTRGFALCNLPFAMLRGEWDLANKLFQWILPSKFTLVGLLILIALIITIADWVLCFKWYCLLLVLILAFIMALPEGEISRRFRKIVWLAPYYMFIAIVAPLIDRLYMTSKKRKKKNNKEQQENDKISEALQQIGGI